MYSRHLEETDVRHADLVFRFIWLILHVYWGYVDCTYPLSKDFWNNSAYTGVNSWQTSSGRLILFGPAALLRLSLCSSLGIPYSVMRGCTIWFDIAVELPPGLYLCSVVKIVEGQKCNTSTTYLAFCLSTIFVPGLLHSWMSSHLQFLLFNQPAVGYISFLEGIF